MHADLRSLDLAELEGEVCVIGAGAAGITVARRLLDLGHHVILLESGGKDFEADTSALNHGESIGQDYYKLEHARLRFFGGTAAIWGGRVAELDPIDFERRDWVPHSGWPIGIDDVRPYYDEAWGLLGCKRPDSGLGNVELPLFRDDQLGLHYWGFDPDSARFGFRSCSDLREHPRCLVLTHATVTEILTGPDGATAEQLVVKAHGGRELRLKAKVFVVAAGGIENARLLLASNSRFEAGLGNGRDLVGRYFMEHPHSRGGRVVSGAFWQLMKGFGRSHRVAGQRVAALIATAREKQAELQILNTSMTLAPRQPADSTQFAAMRLYNKAKHDLPPSLLARTLWRRGKSMVTAAQMLADPLRPWLLNRMGVLDLALLIRAEQAPNPDSRILLGKQRDALGMQQVKLDWRLTELDKRSVVGLVDTFADECGRLSLGQVERAPWLTDADQVWSTDPLISAHPIGGYHHMGTTRMAASDREGVADQYGRMFALPNVYIAGSSLFPTSGWANPTLTLMALGLRTADRISRELTVDVSPNVSRLPEPAALPEPEPAAASQTGGNVAGGVLKRALGNAGRLLGGKAISGLMQLATFAIAARMLGLADFGHLSVMLAGMQLLISLATFQSNQAIVRYGVEHVEAGDRRAFQSLLKFGTLLDVGAAVAASALAFAIAPLVGRYAGWSPELIADWRWLSLLPLTLAVATPKGILRLFGRFDLLARHVAVTPFARLTGAVLIALTGGRLLDWVIMWIVAGAAGVAVGAWLGWREAKLRGLLEGFDWSLGGFHAGNPGIGRFSLIANLHSSLVLLPGHVSTFAVGMVLGPEEAGLMKVAQELGTALAKPIDLINQSVYPDIARLAAARAWGRVRKLVARSGVAAASLSAVITLLLATFGEYVIEPVFGVEFVGAQTLLLMVSLSTTVAVGVFAVDPTLYAIGKPSRPLISAAVSNLLFVAVLFGGFDLFGLYSPGVAYIVAAVATVGSALWWMARAVPEPEPALAGGLSAA